MNSLFLPKKSIGSVYFDVNGVDIEVGVEQGRNPDGSIIYIAQFVFNISINNEHEYYYATDLLQKISTLSNDNKFKCKIYGDNKRNVLNVCKEFISIIHSPFNVHEDVVVVSLSRNSRNGNARIDVMNCVILYNDDVSLCFSFNSRDESIGYNDMIGAQLITRIPKYEGASICLYLCGAAMEPVALPTRIFYERNIDVTKVASYMIEDLQKNSVRKHTR